MRKAELPSNRSFGALFSAVGALLGALSWYRGWGLTAYFLGAGAIFGTLTLVRPEWLAPLNRAWMRLALILNRVVSPIVLGALYFGVVTPFGIVRRTLGSDLMRRGREPQAATYWIRREPPGPPPDSLRDQF